MHEEVLFELVNIPWETKHSVGAHHHNGSKGRVTQAHSHGSACLGSQLQSAVGVVLKVERLDNTVTAKPDSAVQFEILHLEMSAGLSSAPFLLPPPPPPPSFFFPSFLAGACPLLAALAPSAAEEPEAEAAAGWEAEEACGCA